MKKVQPEPKIQREGMMPREWVIIYILIFAVITLSVVILIR